MYQHGCPPALCSSVDTDDFSRIDAGGAVQGAPEQFVKNDRSMPAVQATGRVPHARNRPAMPAGA